MIERYVKQGADLAVYMFQRGKSGMSAEKALEYAKRQLPNSGMAAAINPLMKAELNKAFTSEVQQENQS